MHIESASFCEWEDSFWGLEWPSEELWKKFECDSPQESELDEEDEFYSEEDPLLTGLSFEDLHQSPTPPHRSPANSCSTLGKGIPRQIRIHDCMWAGVCLSKDHRPTRRVVVALPSRSLLRPSRPETPQSEDGGCQEEEEEDDDDDDEEDEDDEELESGEAASGEFRGVSASEVMGQKTVLSNPANTPQQNQFLHIHQSSGRKPPPGGGAAQEGSHFKGTTEDLSHDHDYQMKRGGRRVAEEESHHNQRHNHRRHHHTAASPVPRHHHIHHHHTTKSQAQTNPAPLVPDDLGVQTPSDSEEEEIDVVSVRGNSGSVVSLTPTPGVGLHQRLLSASEAVSKRLRRNPSSPPSQGHGVKRKEPPSEDNYLPPPHQKPRKRHSPKKNSRFSTDSETDSERRSLHNNMERMRRIDLRNAFDDLRSLVPGLVGAPGRAAKVTILKDAASYCVELASKGEEMSDTIAALRRKQQRLRADLSQLRRNLAASR